MFAGLVAEGQRPEVLVIVFGFARRPCDPAARAAGRAVRRAHRAPIFVLPHSPRQAASRLVPALELGVRDLEVKHIVVLGHSRCGGIQALRRYQQDPSRQSDRQFIASWVAIAACPRATRDCAENDMSALEQAAIGVSLANLHAFRGSPIASPRARSSSTAGGSISNTARLWAHDWTSTASSFSPEVFATLLVRLTALVISICWKYGNQRSRRRTRRYARQGSAVGVPPPRPGRPRTLSPGTIAEADLPGPTLSFHLAQLRQAGLVTVRRDGRSLIYAADYDDERADGLSRPELLPRRHRHLRARLPASAAPAIAAQRA